MYTPTYRTARSVLQFVILVGWVLVAIGVIALLAGLGQLGGDSEIGRGAALGLVPIAIVMGVSGLISVAIGQVGVALLDQSDMTRAVLAIATTFARQQGLQTDTATARGATLATSNEVSEGDSSADSPMSQDYTVRHHKGEIIEKNGRRWRVRGEDFATLGQAKRFLDNNPARD